MLKVQKRLVTGALAAMVFGVCAGANAAPLLVFDFDDEDAVDDVAAELIADDVDALPLPDDVDDEEDDETDEPLADDVDGELLFEDDDEPNDRTHFFATVSHVRLRAAQSASPSQW